MKFIIMLLVVLLPIAALLIGSGRVENRRRAECESKGGFYFSSRGGDLCLKKDVVIQLR